MTRRSAVLLRFAHYRFAYLNTTELSGLPATIVDGRTYHFESLGVLKVKQKQPRSHGTSPVRSQRHAERHRDTHVKMSQFGIGPISLVGLVTTGDDVDLTMHLAARPVEVLGARPTVRGARPRTHTGTARPSRPRDADPRAELRVVPHAGSGRCRPLELDGAGAAAQSPTVGRRHPAKYMPPWPASDGRPAAHSKALDARGDRRDPRAMGRWPAVRIDVPASTPIPPARRPIRARSPATT